MSWQKVNEIRQRTTDVLGIIILGLAALATFPMVYMLYKLALGGSLVCR